MRLVRADPFCSDCTRKVAIDGVLDVRELTVVLETVVQLMAQGGPVCRGVNNRGSIIIIKMRDNL